MCVMSGRVGHFEGSLSSERHLQEGGRTSGIILRGRKRKGPLQTSEETDLRRPRVPAAIPHVMI